MTTVDSLKALYVKLGGKAEDVAGLNLIPECIDALNDVAGAGGGGYDMVFLCDGQSFDEVAAHYKIVSGSFDDIVKKLQSGEMIRACAYESYEYSSEVEPYLPDSTSTFELFSVSTGEADYSRIVFGGANITAAVDETKVVAAYVNTLGIVITSEGIYSVNCKNKELALAT